MKRAPYHPITVVTPPPTPSPTHHRRRRRRFVQMSQFTSLQISGLCFGPHFSHFSRTCAKSRPEALKGYQNRSKALKGAQKQAQKQAQRRSKSSDLRISPASGNSAFFSNAKQRRYILENIVSSNALLPYWEIGNEGRNRCGACVERICSPFDCCSVRSLSSAGVVKLYAHRCRYNVYLAFTSRLLLSSVRSLRSSLSGPS